MYSYSMHPLETVSQVCSRVCLSVRALRIICWMCKIYVWSLCILCVCVCILCVRVESCVYYVCAWGVCVCEVLCILCVCVCVRGECVCGVQVHLFSFGDA